MASVIDNNLTGSTANAPGTLFDPQSGPQTDSPPVDTQTPSQGYTPPDPQTIADTYGTGTAEASVYDLQSCRLPTIWDLEAGLRAAEQYGRTLDAAVAARQNVPAPDVTGDVVVLGEPYGPDGRPIYYENDFRTPYRIEVLGDAYAADGALILYEGEYAIVGESPAYGDADIPIYLSDEPIRSCEVVDPFARTSYVATEFQIPGEVTNAQVPSPLAASIAEPIGIPGWGDIYAPPRSPGEAAFLSGLQAAYEACTPFTPVAGADYSTANGEMIADALLAEPYDFQMFGDRHGTPRIVEEAPMCLAARGVTVFNGNLPPETPSQTPVPSTADAPSSTGTAEPAGWRPPNPQAVADAYGMTAAEEAAFDAAFCDPSEVRTTSAEQRAAVEAQPQAAPSTTEDGGWLSDIEAKLQEAVQMYNVNRMEACEAQTQASAEVRAAGRPSDPRPPSYSPETMAWADGQQLPSQDAFSEAYEAQRTATESQMGIGTSDTVAAPEMVAEPALPEGARPVCVESVPAEFEGLKFAAGEWLGLWGEQPTVVGATYGEQSAPIRAAVYDGFMSHVQEYFVQGLNPVFLTGEQNGNGGRLAVFVQGSDTPVWLDHDGSVVEHVEEGKTYRFIRENGSFRVEVVDYVAQPASSETVSMRPAPRTGEEVRVSAEGPARAVVLPGEAVVNYSGVPVAEPMRVGQAALGSSTCTGTFDESRSQDAARTSSPSSSGEGVFSGFARGVAGFFSGLLTMMGLGQVESALGIDEVPGVRYLAHGLNFYAGHVATMMAGSGMDIAAAATSRASLIAFYEGGGRFMAIMPLISRAMDAMGLTPQRMGAVGYGATVIGSTMIADRALSATGDLAVQITKNRLGEGAAARLGTALRFASRAVATIAWADLAWTVGVDLWNAGENAIASAAFDSLELQQDAILAAAYCHDNETNQWCDTFDDYQESALDAHHLVSMAGDDARMREARANITEQAAMTRANLMNLLYNLVVAEVESQMEQGSYVVDAQFINNRIEDIIRTAYGASSLPDGIGGTPMDDDCDAGASACLDWAEQDEIQSYREFERMVMTGAYTIDGLRLEFSPEEFELNTRRFLAAKLDEIGGATGMFAIANGGSVDSFQATVQRGHATEIAGLMQGDIIANWNLDRLNRMQTLISSAHEVDGMLVIDETSLSEGERIVSAMDVGSGLVSDVSGDGYYVIHTDSPVYQEFEAIMVAQLAQMSDEQRQQVFDRAGSLQS